MTVVVHPRRRLRYDLCALALVLAIPLGLLLAFPYQAIGFVPREPAAASARCAFVTLTHEQERRILTAARSAWQVGAEAVRGLRVEMSAGELPPAPARAVLSVRDVRAEHDLSHADFEPAALPPSCGAMRPSALEQDANPAAPPPAFARDELLQLH